MAAESTPSRRSLFRTEATRPTRASRATVMALLLTPTARPRWQPEIVEMQGPPRLTEGSEQVGRARMLGFDVVGKSTAIAVRPDAFEEDVIVGVGLRVRYEVLEAGDGVAIRHLLSTDLPRGPLGRLLSVFLRRRLRRMQRHAVRNLALQSEATPSGTAPSR